MVFFSSMMMLQAMEVTLSADEAMNYGLALLQTHLESRLITQSLYDRVAQQLARQINDHGLLIDESAIQHLIAQGIRSIERPVGQSQPAATHNDEDLARALALSMENNATAHAHDDTDAALLASAQQFEHETYVKAQTQALKEQDEDEQIEKALYESYKQLVRPAQSTTQTSQRNGKEEMQINDEDAALLKEAIALSKAPHYPLHDAVKNGNERLVESLLKNGNKADARDDQGHLAWFYAFQNNNYSLIREALKFAAQKADNICCVCQEKVGQALFAVASDDCLDFICKDCKKENDKKYYPDEENPHYWVIRGCPICQKGRKNNRTDNK